MTAQGVRPLNRERRCIQLPLRGPRAQVTEASHAPGTLACAGTADAARGRLRSKKRINLSLDEWNVWYQARFSMSTGDLVEAPELLEDIYSALDAVVVGDLLVSMCETRRPGADRLPGSTRECDCADPNPQGWAGLAPDHVLSVRRDRGSPWLARAPRQRAGSAYGDRPVRRGRRSERGRHCHPTRRQSDQPCRVHGEPRREPAGGR
jgi:hypothetical protein